MLPTSDSSDSRQLEIGHSSRECARNFQGTSAEMSKVKLPNGKIKAAAAARSDYIGPC